MNTRRPKGRIPRVPRHSHPIVRRLVEEMIASGKSYGDLARRSGVGFSTICSWTTNKTPNIQNLEAVLNALDLDLVIKPRRGSRIVADIIHGEGPLR